MRTTIDIADDVLFAAKEIARRQKKSLGEVISDLARQSFHLSCDPSEAGKVTDKTSIQRVFTASEKLAHYGIKPLPKRGGIVTNELIDRLRDLEGI